MKCNSDRTNYLAFNPIAELYDEVRPGYPKELYRDILSYVPVRSGISALEIGCGTGQATVPFAEAGLNITAIEPGDQLADLTRKNTRQFKGIDILVSTFEEAQLPVSHFDLVYSATAFHWVAPSVAYSKTSEILVDDGVLAVFWNLMPEFEAEFENDLSAIIQEVETSLIQSTFGKPSAESIREGFAELQESGYFQDAEQRIYAWDLEMGAEAFTALLETFANYQTLPKSKKELLFAAIPQLIEEKYHASIKVQYTTVLNVARKAA